ncbi:MAG: Uma2 family endonuclease [Candidatus Bipolaricaulia bacterium]
MEICDEDLKAELIRGVLVVSTLASVRHEQLQGFLLALLRTYVEVHNLGMVLGSRTPMRLKDEYFEPDILFVAQNRLERLGEVFLDGPADLVVEIVSPGLRALDRVIKRQAHEKHGVREYWLIDPERQSATSYLLEKNRFAELPLEEGVYRSQALPGFWLRVAWLWQEPLPAVLEVLRKLELI